MSMTLRKRKTSSASLWIRVFILAAALVFIFYSIRYLRSGQLESNPAVQTFLNPDLEPLPKAHLVIDKAPPEGIPQKTKEH